MCLDTFGELENHLRYRLVELTLHARPPGASGQAWEQNPHLTPQEHPRAATCPAERIRSNRVTAKPSVEIKIAIFLISTLVEGLFSYAKYMHRSYSSLFEKWKVVLTSSGETWILHWVLWIPLLTSLYQQPLQSDTITFSSWGRSAGAFCRQGDARDCSTFLMGSSPLVSRSWKM